MPELFKNAPVTALIGVVIGAVLTSGLNLLSAWATRNRDFTLKLWERFLDLELPHMKPSSASPSKCGLYVPSERFMRARLFALRKS
jgi:hypothetical protein